jgi:hypothetical protein
MRLQLKRVIPLWVMGLMTVQLALAGDQITVDSTSDQPQAGLTTLREAIDEANTLSGAEIIFDPLVFSAPQTITLEQGDMIITEPMTISGPGSDLLIIDADNLSRIFTLEDGNGQGAFTVNIAGMTLTNGNGESAIGNGRGGCVYSNEKLKLIASVIKNCSASTRGGGVETNRAGNLIENSLFQNNSTPGIGGGLFHQSSVGSKVIGSTFIGNSADSRGGGLHVSQTGAFEVINSTFTNNQASTGAGISATSALNINNSTIVDNLGEGVNLRQDTIQNSIVAGNTDGDCVFTNTGFDNLHNLDTDGSCVGDTVNGHLTVADPMLEALVITGGLTASHRPLPDSPVIDSGDDLFCAETDQRGQLRPQDGDDNGDPVCDIGAVERADVEEVIFAGGFDF